MNNLSRLSVALGSGLVLSLGALAPVATATAAPSQAPAATHAQDLIHNPGKDFIERGVTPSECGPTLLDEYFGAQVASISDEDFAFLLEHIDTIFDVPTYEPLFFGTAGDGAHDLTLHAQQLRQTFRDLKKFWAGSAHDGVQFDDIQLMAMHGDVLLDADRIAKTLTLLVQEGFYDLTPEEIATEAETVASYMQSAGDFYDNPLWTLNAYAFSAEGDPDPLVQGLPDKLVFGDGILDFLDWAGLGDVGTRAVMGHEFGHHIQYEIGTFDDEPADPSEATRRTELMADAYASYFMVHKKGEAINKKRAVDAVLTSYSVGDCSFDSSGHHGTPLQRQRAAEWGADLAMAASPKSYVLDATVFEEMFDAALPGIISG
ncbi:hypothetical protein [Nocardioides bigeumensis]|uniref:Neutral zinc metallopeptidase n=1 Tax=Nocardioides bigeumensis TaxID=433657 RepID=A0ABP5JKP6_9ACTN